MLRTCVSCCAMMIAGLTVGCGQSKDTTKDTKLTSTKKDELVIAYKGDLGKLEKQVDGLKTKAEKAAGDEKVKLDAQLKDAGAKRDAAKKKLDELEKAAADKWEAVSKEAATAFDDLKKAVKE
ncbi:hypothetical protein R5W23_005946 [Gemmata sp. JC673]|uniref:Uncharacterized protein n=1 Tax=Gemmata algarum TaxID=2975278 RepID=A0ABU5EU65_9BACT|nr:hypothetical protein [Gemmata algarum]MDY3558789.1 hypothetical protein [Gemmata algarum]